MYVLQCHPVPFKANKGPREEEKAGPDILGMMVFAAAADILRMVHHLSQRH